MIFVSDLEEENIKQAALTELADNFYQDSKI